MRTERYKDLGSVLCETTEHNSRWDEFLQECPGAHFEQTSAWGRLKALYGWNSRWIWVEKGGRIAAGAMLLTRRMGPIATVGYVIRGPVWRQGDSVSMQTAMEAICKVAGSLRLTYLVVVPPYEAGELIPALQSLSFHVKPESLPPSVDTATLVIDLRQDLDAILAGMSMTKRQNIRRGIRRGVRVRTGENEDVETFRRLMWQLAARRNVQPGPPQRDFFDNLQRIAGPQGNVRFHFAEVNGEPVSAACSMLFGRRLCLWRIGWSGKYADCEPNDVLHWEIMKWAKENGYSEFDFGHIRRAHAKTLLQGGKISDSYSGVTNFKTSFGGQLRLLPEHYYSSFHPVVRSVLRLGGTRVLASEVGIGVFQTVADRFMGAAESSAR